MLAKQNKPKVVKGILFTGVLTLLASCGNSSALESMVRADPNLRESNAELNLETANEEALDRDNTVSITPSDDISTTDEAVTEPELSNNSPSEPVIEDVLEPLETTDDLPANFPASFPIYPKVDLKEAKTGEDEKSGEIAWTSSDNIKAIADYYQAELTANDWEIIKPFALDPEAEIARAIAVKNNNKVHLNLLRSRDRDGNNGTKLSAIYEPLKDTSVASNSPSNTASKPNQSKQKSNFPGDRTSDKPPNAEEETDLFPEVVRNKQNALARGTLENDDYVALTNSDFDDLDNVSEPLMQPLETVAALGILSPYTQEGNVEVSKFAPNAVITRGEYARWLIAANNLYYEGDPGKKIYVVNDTNQPAFQDIKDNNPDFGAIQGLAEAGLVPSRLTQDSTKLMFRPDAPLTREELVTWKVPLDIRQALPKASIEAIQESWGFQDAASIDSSAVRALYADYQNGDRSNVRRIFGFTTLFQPKKPVTRAEAAASLWYFGYQGDGITAQEILESEAETETESNS